MDDWSLYCASILGKRESWMNTIKFSNISVANPPKKASFCKIRCFLNFSPEAANISTQICPSHFTPHPRQLSIQIGGLRCRRLVERRRRPQWSLCQKSPPSRRHWTITQIQNPWVFPESLLITSYAYCLFAVQQWWRWLLRHDHQTKIYNFLCVCTGSLQLSPPNASYWGSQWHDGRSIYILALFHEKFTPKK